MREAATSDVEAFGLYRTVGISVVAGLAAFHGGAYDNRRRVPVDLRGGGAGRLWSRERRVRLRRPQRSGNLRMAGPSCAH